MPTFDEVHEAYDQRLAKSRPNSPRAFYEIMVPRFALPAASLPFAIGSVLAVYRGSAFSWPVFVISSVVVFLIMTSVNAGNTYFDYETDAQNQEFSAYSGGIRILVEGKITNRRHALYFACALMALAFPLGLSLYFLLHTGPWTLALGFFGALCGWFYTSPPLKLVYRGLGELVIAICSGMLTVVTGYYLQAGRFDLAIAPVALALAAGILNVIVVNEFADRPADARSGKRTWLVCFGPERAAQLYQADQVIAFAALAAGPLFGLPWYVAWGTAAIVLPQAWRNRRAIRAGAWRGDGINELTLNTFGVQLLVQLGLLAGLLLALGLRHIAGN
jgi:1,4-dihydroxy-2-naphthoate octaprenyltransferase